MEVIKEVDIIDVESQDVIDFGKAVSRLMLNKDFQKVILEGYIDKTALRVGKEFIGSKTQLDELVSISGLREFLDFSVEQANIYKMEK